MTYDFKGYATKNDILCSDGRTIKKDAFKSQHGKTVPLVWAHIHDDPFAVLGHALLENVDDGVIAYGFFNMDTEAGRNAKALVDHGDVDSLSICAGKLTQDDHKNVYHGRIKEVSLVLAGANDGAKIEPKIVHSDDADEIVYLYSNEFFELNHSNEEAPDLSVENNNETEDKEGEIEMADKEKTVQDVIDTMNEEQKTVLFALVDAAMKEGEETSAKEDDTVKHNLFDTETIVETSSNVLTHSDFEKIKTNAKRAGSFKDAYNDYVAELQHDDEEPTEYRDREGNVIDYNRNADGTPYGVGNYTYMFPDARLVGERPAMIKRDTGWVSKVMNGVKHSPFARIKTMAADITEDAARAKGYIKGKMKKEEFFSLMRRSTSPTTIYKKQKMDRDDVIDITEWDVIAWLKVEMRGMLNEEAARAMLIGDGRLPSDEDHIDPQCIRPIAYDSDLYTIKVTIDDDSLVESTGSDARDLINAVIKSRKDYKGSGNPMLFTTEDMLTDCLMLTDEIGRDLYDSEAKLATKMRVSEIVTVPVLENNADGIVGILVNLNDYTAGADKGGAVSMFDDFDIDYNQQKYLIETRMSGALTKPYSAIVFKKTVSGSDDSEG